MTKSELISILESIPGNPDIMIQECNNHHWGFIADHICCIVQQGSGIYLLPSEWRDHIHHFDISDDQEEIHYHDS